MARGIMKSYQVLGGFDITQFEIMVSGIQEFEDTLNISDKNLCNCKIINQANGMETVFFTIKGDKYPFCVVTEADDELMKYIKDNYEIF